MRPRPLQVAARCLLLAVLLFGSVAWAPSRPPAAGDTTVEVPLQVARAPAQPPPPSHLLARIYSSSQAERDQLAAQLDAVETATTGGYVTPLITPDEQAELVAKGYRVEIDAARTALLNAQPPISPAQTE